MKQYKHKTTGIIGTLKEDGHLHFERGEECVTHETIWKGFIENSCDWEEVDYEILSFTGGGSKEVYIKDEKGIFRGCLDNEFNNYGNWRTLEHLINKAPACKIFSVKRLSDGEVFSVGDKYKNMSGVFTIDGFKIQDNKVVVTAEQYGCCNLNSIEKVKSVLFQSFEGENVVQGQPYYAVTKDFELAYCSFYSEHDLDMKLFAKKENAENYLKTYKDYKTADGEQIVEGQTFYVYDDKYFKCIKTCFGNFTSDKWAGKRFKTEDEVNELILMNKPCLSLKEVHEIGNKPIYGLESLKELVKQKLKY